MEAIQVIAMQEEADDALMPERASGEREGFAYKTAQTLAERIIEAFDMIFRTSVVGGAMLRWGKDIVVTFQGVAIDVPKTVGGWDTVPKARGGGVTARPQSIGDNLAGASA